MLPGPTLSDGTLVVYPRVKISSGRCGPLCKVLHAMKYFAVALKRGGGFELTGVFDTDISPEGGSLPNSVCRLHYFGVRHSSVRKKLRVL